MASGVDTIMAELVGAGYTTGSVSDRERARLMAKTASNGKGKGLADLYAMASEKHRLGGKK